MLATASNQMKASRSRTRNSGYAGGHQFAQLVSHRHPRRPVQNERSPHGQMDPDPVILRFSPDEWNKVASGLVLSPDDLRMIEAGLELLENSQIQLADLAKAEHRTDNMANALEDWAKKIGELAARILEHHSSCLLKLMAAQEPKTEAADT